MPNFKPYPTAITMPNRKQRKAARRRIFAENSAAYADARRARRDTKRKEKQNA